MEGGNRGPRRGHRPWPRGGVRLPPRGGDERARPRGGEGRGGVPRPGEQSRNLGERERGRPRRDGGRSPREDDPRYDRGEPVPPDPGSREPDCPRTPEGGSEGGPRAPSGRADSST